MANPGWTAAQIPRELDDILNEVVSTSPHIASESALVRHGLRLALQDAIDRKLIDDPLLRDRVTLWLQESARAIGEPIIRIH